jgi:hypothetical protein
VPHLLQKLARASGTDSPLIRPENTSAFSLLHFGQLIILLLSGLMIKKNFSQQVNEGDG